MKRADLIFVCSDMHFGHVHRPTWNAFMKCVEHVKPKMVVAAGDFVDLPSLSIYATDPTEPQAAILGIREWVKEANRLKGIAERVVIIEGNHEHRWARKILEPLAHQLIGSHGLTLREQCGSAGMHHAIEWYTENLTWKGLEVGQFLIRHGHKQSGKWSPANLARNALIRTLGQSQLFGHHHRIEMVCIGTRNKTRVAIANGHMEDEVEYSLENNWTRGFTILELDQERGWCTPYPVIVEDGRFSFAGTIYDGNERKALNGRSADTATKKAKAGGRIQRVLAGSEKVRRALAGLSR